MIYTDKTKLAMKTLFKYQKEETDISGIPYIFHPWHVAESMTDEDSTCIALMHDLIEDTDVTLEDVKNLGFNDKIIEALRLLTKKKGENYFSYIKRVKENNLATKVKISDLKHNMDLTRLNSITKKDRERKEKYQKALDYLENKTKEL